MGIKHIHIIFITVSILLGAYCFAWAWQMFVKTSSAAYLWGAGATLILIPMSVAYLIKFSQKMKLL